METKIKTQIGDNPKNGIYEVFVSREDYDEYFNLSDTKTPNINQKMYAVVWDGEVEYLCLEERRAWANLKASARMKV